MMAQVMVPGVIGISTYVDYAYHREMQLTARRLAGTDGPINQLRVVTATLDFHRLVTNVRAGRWEAAEEQVAEAAVALASGGADFVVVTSGTTSTLTGAARQRVQLAFLDLAESAWQEAGDARSVGLLATQRAAAGGIFQAAAERRGATLLLPRPTLAAEIDSLIFDELVRGEVTEAAVRTLREAVAELADAGAERVILGNTDMTLAVDRMGETAVPIIDGACATRAGERPRCPAG